MSKQILTIFHRDGTTIEFEPIKPWSPCGHDEGKRCHICDREDEDNSETSV